MKLIFRFLYIILFLLIAITACEYQTDDVFFREIDREVPLPDLNIDLNINTDTIYVYDYSTVKLSFSLTNKDLYDVKFYINDAEVEGIYKTDNYNYYFYIDISKYSVAKVRAEIYTSTETNSIADIIGAEAYIYQSDEWTLIRCDDDLTYNTTIENGRLKISWTPIKSKLKRRYYITSSNIKDSTFNNWYIDSNYIGGNNHISITYDDDDISGFGIYDEIYNYDHQKVYINNKDSFYIYWNKFYYYNSIQGYKLVVNEDTFLFSPNDTSLTYKNGVFGNSYPVNLYIIPFKNNPNYNDDVLLSSSSAYYPSAFLEYHTNLKYSYFPLIGSSFYYWAYDNNVLTFYKFDLNSKTILYSKAISSTDFKASPNDQYILVEENDYITILNSNLQKLKRILKSNYSTNVFSWQVYISDNARTVFYDDLKASLIVFDFISESIITEIPVSSRNANYKISSNGSYVYDHNSNTLYKIGNSGYSIIYSDTQKYTFYEFSPTTEQIVLYDGTIFYLKYCLDYSTERSFSLNNNIIANIDYQNHKILTYNDNNEFIIYSLNDGSIIDTIPSSYTSNAYIFNNFIIKEHCQYNLNN